MKYPDGQEIRVGDVVWVNEGTQIARIAEILEEEADFRAAGVEEPSILVCFDVLGRRLESHMFNSEEQLADEGVGLLTEEEWQAQLDELIEERKKSRSS